MPNNTYKVSVLAVLLVLSAVAVSASEAKYNLTDFFDKMNKEKNYGINYKWMFDDNEFRKAFKDSAGDAVYSAFFAAWKSGRKFQYIGNIEKNESGIAAKVANLDGHQFECAVAVDTVKNELLVCWDDFSDTKLSGLYYPQKQKRPLTKGACEAKDMLSLVGR